jgi:translation initiation factor IF-1
VSRANAIVVEGTVVVALPNLLYRVELANGHRVLAHLPGKARRSQVRFALGDKVILEMSPYDLSCGRIVLEQK